MLTKFRRFIGPPDLGDVEKNRRVKFIHPILLVLIPATIAFVGIIFWLTPENSFSKYLVLAVLLAESLAFLWLKRGRLDLASVGLLSMLWAIAQVSVYAGSGIRGLSMLSQLLIIMMSALMVSEGFAVLITILTIIGNYGAMLAQNAGPLPYPDLAPELPAVWALQALYFVVTLGLAQAYIRNLRAAFNESNRQMQTLEGRVSELRQTQAQLEMADKTLRRREAILESASIAAEKLFRGKSFGESIQVVLKDLGTATGVDRVHIFENHRDARGDLMASERYEWAGDGVSPLMRDPRFQSMSYKDTGLERWATIMGRNEIFKAHVKDLPERERTRIAPQGLLSILLVPIFLGADWWGFIGFDEAKHERQWSPEEIDALRGAAGILGGAFERRRSERALNQSEARYLAILQDQYDLICRYRPDGLVTFANDAYCRYFGITPADFPKQTIWGHVLPTDTEALRAKIEALTAKQPASISLARNRRADGEMRWVEWTDRGIFDETNQLIEVQAVGRDIDEEVRLRSQLEDNLRKTETQAMTDPLTGLLNRRAILEHAHAEWQRALREKRPLSVVIMDLDNLKLINDTYGHLVGDSAINRVADTMRASMRRYDWVGRIGGDEFLLILPGAGLDEARNVAERLRIRIRQSKLPLNNGQELELQLSLGVACERAVSEGPDLVESLIAKADRALYAAKQAGRDQVGVAE